MTHLLTTRSRTGSQPVCVPLSAGRDLLAVASSALPASAQTATAHAPSGQPSASAPVTAGQRSALTRQLLTLVPSPVATQLIISNRSARRLEMPESYTKQRTGPLSNRHKFTHHNATSLPTSSPQHRKHEPQESEQRDGRFPRHLFFSKTTFCLARANPVA